LVSPYDPKTGEGVIGRTTLSDAYERNRFLQDQNFNPMLQVAYTVIDDFNGDNFDHGPLGFIGGASSALSSRVVCPLAIIRHRLAHLCGAGVEASCGGILPTGNRVEHPRRLPVYRGNYLDLDPTYKDAWACCCG